MNPEQVNELWLKSGGSLRCIKQAKTFPPLKSIMKVVSRVSQLTFQGPFYAILVWLASEQKENCDLFSLRRLPLSVCTPKLQQLTRQALERQLLIWAAESLTIDKSLVYEYVDQGILSTSWEDDGSISDIGFGTPSQFKEFKASSEVGLSLGQQQQLLDPRTYGEKLEWLVAECLERSTISTKRILCFKKPPSGNDESCVFIPWESFSITTHVNLIMKPFPDDYGTGKFAIAPSSRFSDLIRVSHDGKQTTVYLIQVKLGMFIFKRKLTPLGSSSMSKGKAPKPKPDTVRHAIMQIKEGENKLRLLLEKKIPQFDSVKVLYITRKISSPCLDLLKVMVSLNNSSSTN